MIRLISMLSLLLLTATAPEPPPVAVRNGTAIRAFLAKTLGAYVAGREPPSWRRAFTPSMQRILSLNERLNRGEESEALGADPICGCQDWRTIRITSITLSSVPGGRVMASVKITNFDKATRTFVMARTPAGWRIDDVLENGRYGLRDALLRDNARLIRSSR